MDQQHKVELRKMERKDLQAVLDMINAEGWEYHISEMQRILDVSPDDSVVACSDDMVVGSITSGVSGNRCVLAHVVVKNGWRNKGIGNLMMNYLEERMSSVGVEAMEAYAVPPAVPFYKRHGYHSIEEMDTYHKVLTEKDVSGIPPTGRIRSLGAKDIDSMLSLDRAVTGFDRRNILRQLAIDFPGKAKGLFEKGGMTAFFMFRTCPVMSDLGPWVMAKPDVDDGLMMLRSVLGDLEPGTRALGGVSMNNPVVREIFLSLGFTAIHKAYRMMKSKGEMKPFRPGFMTLSAFEFG